MTFDQHARACIIIFGFRHVRADVKLGLVFDRLIGVSAEPQLGLKARDSHNSAIIVFPHP